MPSTDLKDTNLILATQYEIAKQKFEKDNPTLKVSIDCTYRSFEEQNKLYNQWPKVTLAKGGQSPHNYNPSMAIDVKIINNGHITWERKYFADFAKLMVTKEIEWGGDWKLKSGFVDNPHFQLKTWRDYIVENKNDKK